MGKNNEGERIESREAGKRAWATINKLNGGGKRGFQGKSKQNKAPNSRGRSSGNK